MYFYLSWINLLIVFLIHSLVKGDVFWNCLSDHIRIPSNTENTQMNTTEKLQPENVRQFKPVFEFLFVFFFFFFCAPRSLDSPEKKPLLSYSDGLFGYDKSMSSCFIQERTDVTFASISTILQLTPKLSRWINCKRKWNKGDNILNNLPVLIIFFLPECHETELKKTETERGEEWGKWRQMCPCHPL